MGRHGRRASHPGAGGVVTRVDGSAVDLEAGSVLCAATPELARALAELVQDPS